MEQELSYISDYLNHLLIERGLSDNTIAAYETDLNQFYTYLRDRDLSLFEVSPTIVIDFLAVIEAELQGKPATLARKTAALRGFYQYLLIEDLIDENPLSVLEAAKSETKLPEFLTIEEVDKLLSAPNLTSRTGYRDLAMLEVLYGTGLRVSELICLNMGDIDPLVLFGVLVKEPRNGLSPSAARPLKLWNTISSAAAVNWLKTGVSRHCLLMLEAGA